MIQLRDYQEDLVQQGVDILNRLRIVYFSAEVRTGKTLMALETANRYGAKHVLFITKKRAIPSIQGDYDLLQPNFEITIINKESLHKIERDDFDLIVLDECHGIGGAYPKPTLVAKAIKQRFGHLPMVALSGTASIESGSQWYHQFWLSNSSPFKGYKNFYAWAKEFTIPTLKYLGAFQVKDYSKSIDEKIMPIIRPYLLTITQQEAGFKAKITERILYYTQSDLTSKLVSTLLKDLVIEGKNETILADSASKLMSKIHQLENGTIIFDSGESMILDRTKAEFVRDHFKGKKLAIFYNFKKEYELICEVLGKENVTNELDVFNSTDKHIALQQISGSEGISLKAADCLVFYNWGYSGKTYTQARDRMTTKEREENSVYFIMAKKSLNERIYKAVTKKKRYNDKIFVKDYKLNTLFNGAGAGSTE